MSEQKKDFGAEVSKMRGDVSQAAIERRSELLSDTGKPERITQSYLNKIEKGGVKGDSLTVRKILQLARGLNVPAQIIFRLAAGIEQPETELLNQIADYAKRLSIERRQDILLIAKAFYNETDEPFDVDEPSGIPPGADIKIARDPRVIKKEQEQAKK